MLAKNDVEKIEPVMNKNIVRVYIKKDSLKNPITRNCLAISGPMFTIQRKLLISQFTYSKVEDYQENLDEYFQRHIRKYKPVPVYPDQ